MLPYILSLTAFVLAQTNEPPVEFQLPGPCNQTMHQGEECDDSKPTVKFFMDRDTLTCLAFLHKGCGGNDNQFTSKHNCQRQCLPMDFVTCPANTPRVPREDGTSYCSNKDPTVPPCPNNSVCVAGFEVGVCCDAKVRAEVNANYKPDCGPTRKAVKTEQFGFMMVLLGKSCEHSFCPTEAECRDGRYFSYCCQ